MAALLFLAVCLMAGPVLAQSESTPQEAPSPAEPSPGPVGEPIKGLAFLTPEGETLAAGQAAGFILVVGINPGFHLSSDKPAADWMIPTRLTLEPHPLVEVVEIVFPEATPMSLPLAEEPVLVFDKMLLIALRLKASPDAPDGPLFLKGRLDYQACTDTACLPPAQMSFQLALNIGPALAGPLAAEEESPQSLPFFLLTVFLLGLALNLSPCVYPLFPITVGYFGGQSRSRAHLLTHLIVYLVSLMAAYTALGTVAALTGQILGAALQHPITLIAIAAIIVALALSLFGLYEFRLPGFISRLGGAGTGRKGYLGTVLMGLTLGIVAAPCLGPATAAVMTVVARSADPAVGAGVFASLSFGLGLPLVVIGFFSSVLIGRMPSAGPWLIWVRRLLGAVMVLMAIYLLRPLIGETAWPWLMALAAMGGGILAFLSGKAIRTWLRTTLSLAWLIPVLFFVLTSTTAPATSEDWTLYSPKALAAAEEEGKPVILDFYADWCAPCRIIKKNLADPEVVALSRKLVTLKVDLTTGGSPEAKTLVRRYQIQGLPSLIFLSPDGQEAKDLRIVGAVGSQEIARRMEELLKR
ncbi:MAG: thioredoxin family protein [Deltaproteobacteria bacterium]|nr:thioredoxin family protein [Deltaproteobacteria bacterium]